VGWIGPKVKDFPPDPVEPPELWADDPEMWALVRHDAAHSSAFWKVILACGHVETVVTDVEQMRLVKARYPRPAPWLPCTMCTWVKSLVAYERIGWLVPPPKPPRKPRRQRSREEILRAHVKRTERELARLRRELREAEARTDGYV
jgi:hypothetical protein